MSNALKNLFSEIAAEIKAKNGEEGVLYKPAQFPEKIRNIEAGGGSADVRYVTFMSHDGTVELGKKAVAVGDDCANPIVRGIFETPTKESTAQYNYTFLGWSRTVNGGLDETALNTVTEDRTVYANYAGVLREYTVRFWDGDTLLGSQVFTYGATPAFAAEKEGYVLTGWNPEPSPVTGEADYYAQWIEAETILYSGKCGDNATWEITSGGTLRISGTGATYDYAQYPADGTRMPWVDYRSNGTITSIVVSPGITRIGNNLCYAHKNVTSLSLPDTIESIGNNAFGYCEALESIVVPGDVVTCGTRAFQYCTALTSVTILCNDLIASEPFYSCSALSDLYFTSIEQYFGMTGYSMSSEDKGAQWHFGGVPLTPDNTLVIPDGVTSIRKNAFNSYKFLGAVVIPESVTTISQSAFYNSTITSAVFEDPEGWTANNTALVLADPAQAAKYLKDYSYGRYEWTKS